MIAKIHIINRLRSKMRTAKKISVLFQLPDLSLIIPEMFGKEGGSSLSKQRENTPASKAAG